MAHQGTQPPDWSIHDSEWKDLANEKQRLFLAVFTRLGRGDVQLACKAAHIGRRTFYNWKTKDAKFIAALDDAWGVICDRQEEILTAEVSDDGDNKLRMANAHKILAKRRPEVWGDVPEGAEAVPQKVIIRGERGGRDGAE